MLEPGDILFAKQSGNPWLIVKIRKDGILAFSLTRPITYCFLANDINLIFYKLTSSNIEQMATLIKAYDKLRKNGKV